VRFRVSYHRPAELVADHDQQFVQGGFLVRVEPPDGINLWDAVMLEIVTAEARMEIAGQVVQMIPGAGVAVAFSIAEAADLTAAVAAARAASDSAGTGAPAEHVLVIGAGVPAGVGTKSAVSATPRAAPATPSPSTAGANKSGAIHKALHGNRDERMQVLRGGDRNLHRFVLQNPGIGLDEVAFIAKQSTTAPELLKAIADRREWAQRPEIAIALVRNPKTPVPLAIQMLGNVAATDLRQLAKSAGVRMPILQAARRKVVGP
jgi:hypothetical protein